MPTKGRAPSEGAAPNGLTATRDGRASGRNGSGREHPIGHDQLSEIQRARILAAMTEVACERGAANVTVAHVVERAGVSRRTFYELFGDREDCFLAAFDAGIARASRYVLERYDPGAKWAERVRTALTALLGFLDAERGTGQLLIVEALGAGTRALERRRRVVAQMVSAVDEGRREGKTPSGTTPLMAEGVVGAVLSVLHGRLSACPPAVMGSPRTGEGGSGRRIAGAPPTMGGPRMGELAGPLMSIVVLPYLGPAASRRELSRPVAEAPARYPGAPGNPLQDLEMRLTYRTVQVLTAVGASPGSSNRMIGDASGMADQGQVSKLLARLARLGLIENTGAGAARGDPNAWMLTERGGEVHGAIAAQITRS